jgi:PAS domain S-box-containing protein
MERYQKNQRSVLFLQELSRQFKQNKTAVLSDGIVCRLDQAAGDLQESIMFDLRMIANSLDDGIYITKGDGETLFINHAFERMSAFKASEIVGMHLDDIAAKLRPVDNGVTRKILENKKQVNSISTCNRTGIKMLVSGYPIFNDEGEVEIVVVVERGISELVEMKAHLEMSQSRLAVIEENEKLQRQLMHQTIKHLIKDDISRQQFIWHSSSMQKVNKLILQAGRTDVTVLLTGETGVGKEIVANQIYKNSLREGLPFIKVNCAAIPANLIETELFGYAKGAFTGANMQGKAGLFELANKGTMLLDEIGELPVDLQSKLLRVIQQKEVTRVGGTRPISLDVRIIAATNRDLKQMTQEGTFRKDLYYRLNVFPIYIPPLRERAADIEPLAGHFLDIYNRKYSRNLSFDPAIYNGLRSYHWPGNIRELENVVERVCVITDPSATVTWQQLADTFGMHSESAAKLDFRNRSFSEIVDDTERNVLDWALKEYGTTRKAASALKLDHSTIVKKAKRLGISRGK